MAITTATTTTVIRNLTPTITNTAIMALTITTTNTAIVALTIATTNMDHHYHGHGPDVDLAANNREYYDQNVYKYDNPHWLDAIKGQALAIRTAFNFDKENTTVLDFACGTGTLARELAPYAKSIVGVDISGEDIDVFNVKAANAGFSPDVLRGICTELKGEEGELDGEKFDLVTCCAAYHHFPDYTKVTTILAKFLKPGGMLLVLERLAGGDQPNAMGGHDQHGHGIDSEELYPGFQEAGLKDYSFKRTGSFDVQWMVNTSFKFFLVKGTKPTE
ncbi:hypothetical protein CVT24_008033 [Panaeolus cyanescens]|uniref:Methyltransferase domain-containing protein n=1 Tax=Panaeolus cyanescens TaxID=181874 RepID=A0A409YR05_9AGAR|nr:hypothetical protein CVT24_008033 [Panaeolus cyanescens]